MKINTFFAMAALIAGVAASCTQTSELAPQLDPNRGAKGGPTTNPGGGNGAISVDETIAFSVNPATTGVPLTITTTISSVSGVPTCGELRLEQALDANGSPTSSLSAVTWETVEEFAPAAFATGEVAYSYTPTMAGTFGFRAHYVPTGGANKCDDAKYTGAPGVAMDLVVGSECVKSLAPTLTSATELGGGKYRFVVTYTLNDCGEGVTGKLQGGLTAGSTLESASPSGYVVSANAKSTVVSWSGVGAGSYTLTFTKTLKGTTGDNPDGSFNLTGAWSFKIDGVTYPNGYTPRVTFNPNAL